MASRHTSPSATAALTSALSTSLHNHVEQTSNMPPAASLRRFTRSSRHNSAMPSSSTSTVVDLTVLPSPDMPMSRPRKRSLAATADVGSPSLPASPKRRKTSFVSAPVQSPLQKRESVEAVDLLDVDDDTSLSKILEKQRLDTLKSQQKSGEAAPKLCTLQCIICLESPTDLSTTPCGHLFCHICLMESIIAGEQNKAPRCPVCRRKCNRGQVKPLELKLSTRGRKGKEAVRG